MRHSFSPTRSVISQVCICYTHVKDAMYKIETCFKEDITSRTDKLVLHVDAN